MHLTGQKRKWVREPSTRIAVREFTSHVLDEAGAHYVARAYAEAGKLGTWAGLLEFEGQSGAVLQTEVETTQPSVGAVAYWAAGLGDLYLRGALERAKRQDRSPLDRSPVLIRDHERVVTREDGERYAVLSYARRDRHAGWIGWLEFQPAKEGAPVLRTRTETTQPTLQAVVYWADGLEPIYFDGAARRATPAAPPD